MQTRNSDWDLLHILVIASMAWITEHLNVTDFPRYSGA